MKHVTRLLSLFILVSAGIFFANCGGEDPKPSEEETQLNKFNFTWSISDVELEGVTQTGYTGATVTFTGTFRAGGTYEYTSEAPAPTWPNPNAWNPSDSWIFKSDNVGNFIIRAEDGQEMSYAFTDNDKTLTIEIENYQGTTFTGRTNSVAGDWTFVLKR